MSISQFILTWLQSDTGKEVAYALIILLVSTASFMLGRLSYSEEIHTVPIINTTEHKEEVSVSSESQLAGITAIVNAPESVKGEVVGSSKGTKYHYPWCPGARSLSEKNKRWFKTVADAEKAGYTLAKNCKNK